MKQFFILLFMKQIVHPTNFGFRDCSLFMILKGGGVIKMVYKSEN